ncbi:MAG: ATPase [Planctomycetaceae bacterium]|nr:ATPase [Planctomycetaceae bacterium]
MSTVPGKLSPSEFLAELQRDLNRAKSHSSGVSVGNSGAVTAAPKEVSADVQNSVETETKIASNSPNISIADALLGNSFGYVTPPPSVLTVESPATPAATNGNAAPRDNSDAARNSTQITGLLDRVNNLLGPAPTAKAPEGPFVPKAPESIEAAGLTAEEIERLILKMLFQRGVATGRMIASQICMPFILIEPLLKIFKYEQLVVFKSSAAMGDYEYLLTDNGRERARRYASETTYSGSATVTLKSYLQAMSAQSIAKQHATEEDVQRAFSDLIMNMKMLDRLGPAINSGRGMFLFGEPGNGKTSIAERITSCFGSNIWIPKALGIDGDIIRIFDPAVHVPIKQEVSTSLLDANTNIDTRWIQIRRPTVIAGGELTMAELEVRQNQQTKVCESPLQLKSNCGTFVIDDFGRQRMPVTELLNRWIVPLEKRYDFLNLPSGKKIQVPFDQLIIFSTNLEPKDLVDGAFLRRIPYKIEVLDPTEEEFRKLFALVAPGQGFQLDRESLDAVDYLIATHYLAKNRPFRACQPRDLLLQVRNFCLYKTLPRKLTPASFDFACDNYFSVM